MSPDPTKKQEATAEFRRQRLAFQRSLDEAVNRGDIAPMQAQELLRKKGYLPDGGHYKRVHGPFGFAATTIGQFTDDAVHVPASIAAVRDALIDDATGNGGHGHLAALVKGSAGALAGDVRHPIRNPGHLLTDAVTFAVPAAKAGKLASRGASVERAVTKASGEPADFRANYREGRRHAGGNLGSLNPTRGYGGAKTPHRAGLDYARGQDRPSVGWAEHVKWLEGQGRAWNAGVPDSMPFAREMLAAALEKEAAQDAVRAAKRRPAPAGRSGVPSATAATTNSIALALTAASGRGKRLP